MVTPSSVLDFRLYYVYTFMLDRIPLSKVIHLPNGSEIAFGKFVEDYLRCHFESSYIFDAQDGGSQRRIPVWHQAEEEEPEQFRSAVYLRFDHLSLSTPAMVCTIKDIGDGFVASHIALWESGLGVIAIWLQSDANIPEEGLHKLAQRKKLPEITLQGFSQSETPHDLFEKNVRQLREHLRQAARQLPDEASRSLARASAGGIPSLIRKHLADESFGSEDNLRTECTCPDRESLRRRIVKAFFRKDKYTVSSATDRSQGRVKSSSTPEQDRLGGGESVAGRLFEELTWLRETDLLWKEDGLYQEPSVVVMLRLRTGDVPDLTNVDCHGTLESILHGVESDNYDRSHTERTANLFPDRRFVTLLHENCLLVAHSIEWTSSQFDMFFKGLFRTFVALRGRWYFHVVVGEFLDLVTRKLNAQFRDLIRKNGTRDAATRRRLREKEEEIIQVMADYLQSRSMEDPLVRSIGLTPFRALYEIGSTRIFRLQELRDSVRERLGEVDRLFQMVSTYYRRRQYEFPSRTVLSRRSWKWRTLAFSAGVGAVGLWQLIVQSVLPPVCWVGVGVFAFVGICALLGWMLTGPGQ